MAKPHPATPQVQDLAAQGFSDRTIVAALRELGISISRRTVQRIRRGEQLGRPPEPSRSLLRPGERRVPGGTECDECGAAIDVVPCRRCSILGEARARQLGELDRRAELRRQMQSGEGPGAGGQ